MNFEFITAARIIFQPGGLERIGALSAEMGWRALVASGVGLERTQPMLERLAAADVISTLFLVNGEPTIEIVREAVHLAQRDNCDMVIGFGGGSAIDTAKAVAMLLTNPGDVTDYLEVIGRGQALTEPPLPVIAIPTTAGTGAEVTRNAVLEVPDHQVKVSLRSPLMLPKLALVDPELTYSLPPEGTASSGLDALTQLIEPYVCNRPNPLTDALCKDGMQRVACSLRHAYEQGDDPAARQDMALASLFGGLALANARLGAVHGFAGVLGGMITAPHGAICARLLPYVVETNLRALRSREPENPALARYKEVAQILTGRSDAEAEDGVVWLYSICEALAIKSLGDYGLEPEDFPLVIEKSLKASSMQGNPVTLSEAELGKILEWAL